MPPSDRRCIGQIGAGRRHDPDCRRHGPGHGERGWSIPSNGPRPGHVVDLRLPEMAGEHWAEMQARTLLSGESRRLARNESGGEMRIDPRSVTPYCRSRPLRTWHCRLAP
jgi:hypothetical protein